MVRATASPTMVRIKTDTAAEPEDAPLVWSARWSLTTRILAVNILAVALLAGGFFYLDTYRTPLVDTRIAVLVDKLAMFDVALEAGRPDQRHRLTGELQRVTECHLTSLAHHGAQTH